jgi:hypothetical protein
MKIHKGGWWIWEKHLGRSFDFGLSIKIYPDQNPISRRFVIQLSLILFTVFITFIKEKVNCES